MRHDLYSSIITEIKNAYEIKVTFFFLEEENLIVQSSLENDRKCGLINAFLHAFLEASMPKI